MSPRPSPKARGNGRIFRRGGQWWIAFYEPRMVGGKARSVERRESAGPTEREARELLIQRLGERQKGTLIEQGDMRLTVADVMGAWWRAQEFRGAKPKNLRTAGYHIATIVDYMGGELARTITRDRALQWFGVMERDGYAAGTRDLLGSILRAALNLAYRDGRLSKPPVIPSVPVNNARQGFLEPEYVTALVAELAWPEDDIVRMLHCTGWRSGEVMGLAWEWIDWRQKTILIPTSKNGEPRRIEMVGELLDIMTRAQAHRAVGIAGGKRADLCPFVFHHSGQPVNEIIKRWHAARLRARLPLRVPHDLRRSMAKDAMDAGYDAQSVMALGGWKSMSVFTRYRIVDSKRTASVLAGLQRFRRGEQGGEMKGTS